MSFRSLTYANDVFDEFNVKMTVSKSGNLAILAETSKVLNNVAVAYDFYEIEQILSIYAQP